MPAKKIGVLNVTGTSEVSTVLINGLTEAADSLGWELIVKDGDPTPQRWTASVNELVTENVDAILVPLTPVEAMGPALQAARDAGIPIISSGVPVATDEGKTLVDADYSDDFPAMGAALAEWAIAEYGNDVTAVVQRSTISPGADSGVLSFMDTIEQLVAGCSTRRTSTPPTS